MKRNRRILGLSLLVLMLAGCERVEVETRVQSVPKQPRPIIVASARGGASQIDWSVPQGWVQIPAGQMRLAAFQVSKDDPTVLLTVVPLGAESGTVLANVNRWAGQLSLPEFDEAGLSRVVKRIEVASKAVDLVDLLGPESAKPRQRLLGAILPNEGRTYYFKLSGAESIVTPQKEAFEAFVRTVHFDGPGGHGASASNEAAKPTEAAAAAAPSELSFTVTPAGWVKDGPLPLRVVSFKSGQGQALVEVVVSKFPAVGSGAYAENIARWRGQVGLPPLADGELQSSTPVRVGGIEAALFDFTGPEGGPAAKRMLLAWLPRGEEWWFFKMTGSSERIASEKSNFEAFLQSVSFLNVYGTQPQ